MKLKLDATYKSLAFKTNDIFELQFVIPGDEIVETLKIAMMMQHQDIMLGIKIGNDEVIKIGQFFVKSAKLDADLEVVVILHGLINLIEWGNLPLDQMNGICFTIFINGKKVSDE